MTNSRGRAADRLNKMMMAKRRSEPDDDDDGFGLGDLVSGAAGVVGNVYGGPIGGLLAGGASEMIQNTFSDDSPSSQLDNVIAEKSRDDLYKKTFTGAGAWLAKNFPSFGGM
jgi:hypothetical protein